MDSTPTILVSLPARPEYLRILRTVTAAVAVRADFTVDEIEDLKIAVDETASQLLRAGPASTISLQLRVRGSSLEVVATAEPRLPGPWPPPDHDRSLTWQVLQALTDETAYPEDGSTSVRFSKRKA